MSDYPDSDFNDAMARAAEHRADAEQDATDESEPTVTIVADPSIEIRTATQSSDGKDVLLGGLMRVRSGPVTVTMHLSFTTVAEMVAALGKVLANKVAWNEDLES